MVEAVSTAFHPKQTSDERAMSLIIHQIEVVFGRELSHFLGQIWSNESKEF